MSINWTKIATDFKTILFEYTLVCSHKSKQMHVYMYPCTYYFHLIKFCHLLAMVDVCVMCWCPCQWRDLHTEQWLMFVYGMLMHLPVAWPSHRGCTQFCSGWSCRQTSGQTSSRSTSTNQTTLAIRLARTRPRWDCGPQVRLWAPGETVGPGWDCGPRVRLWAQEGHQWLGGYASILINCTLTILSGGNWAN